MDWRAGIFILVGMFALPIASKDPAPSPPAQTIIEDEALIRDDVKTIYYKDQSDLEQASDAAMLFHIPGLTLSDSGGTLEVSEIRYRGLSNSRFLVDLEGLPLNIPLYGLSDANSMFLFAAEHLVANAQSLSISLPTVDRPMAKAVFGFGSLHTLKIGGLAATPIKKHSSIFSAMQLTSTSGNFSFSSPDLVNDPRNHFIRENNDQHRLQGVIKYQLETERNKACVLIALNGHEGGMPGFAQSVTPNLRATGLFAGLKTSISHKIENHEMGLDVANTFFDYGTKEPNRKENIQAQGHEITITFKRRAKPTWLNLDLSQKFVLEKMQQFNKMRMGGGLVISRLARYNVPLRPTIQTMTSLLVFHGGGFLRNNNVAVTIEPFHFLSITGRLKYLNRLPTFMEMYASNQFFEGNDQLKNESIWDIELGTTVRFLPYALMRVNGFIGFINDIIVYVPFLASKYQPINTGLAKRHGLDLSFLIEPFSWLSIDSNNALLFSKIKATNAPLPQAPLFSGMTQLSFKPQNFLLFSLQCRYQSGTTGNIFATLRTKPYGVVNAMVKAHLSDYLSASLTIANVFNNKTMQQAYEIPLPSMTFFGQIEVKNL